MEKKKTFTPPEATRTLPLVKTIVRDILDKGQRRADITAESNDQNTAEAEELLEQLNELFAELDDLGCAYKDWNFTMGLVDFPAVIDGQEVLLCWRSDEPELAYYHGMHEGYGSRKPIPEHLFVTQ